MAKFNVTFRFEKGNSVTNVVEAQSKESLYGLISSNQNWFKNEEHLGLVAVNLKNVNSIIISDHVEPRLRSL
ncbi:hypothetical protein NDK43_09400 [Neobacillus pocheonensis]|uniref:DUF3892 domain-containing protein n=1 Tax=Neobacillus pocheonensis TaxID=363869 RepID=A0ABT0W8A9_9BACI|nr:hypothetical protein [Neobacillus pocheonensis]